VGFAPAAKFWRAFAGAVRIRQMLSHNKSKQLT
jgi:hypothetical protein